MKKIALAAAMTFAALPALAQSTLVPVGPREGYVVYPGTTGSLRPLPAPSINPSAERPTVNPAAEGNANLLNRPIPNYGQVSGGYLNARTPR